MGRISRDRRDIYYRRAKEEGFRARSAYKLLQLDDELHFLSPPQCRCLGSPTYDRSEDSAESSDESNSPRNQWSSCANTTDIGRAQKTEPSTSAEGTVQTATCSTSWPGVWEYPHRAVDLCAAPGSWTQVLRRRLWQNYELKLEDYNRRQRQCMRADRSSDSGDSAERVTADGSDELPSPAAPVAPPDPPMIVAVDLQELAPVPGVFMLKGDITHASTSAAILSFFEHKPADLVVCDGAPDVTGMRDIDEFIQMQLLLAALGTASQVLRPGGTFVCKVFRGEQAALMYMQLMSLFADVRCCKPAASRSSSVEAFVVCRGFSPALELPPHIRSHHKKAEEGQNDNAHLPKTLAVSGSAEGLNALWGEEVVGQLVPFLSCGDIRGMDADRNYSLCRSTYTPMPPTQPPTHPAYELAVLRKKGLLPT